MIKPKRCLYSFGALLSVTGWAKLSFAALLGVLLNFPLVSYDATGHLTYTKNTNLYTITASPIAIKLSAASPPRIINPTGLPPAEVVSINIQVDNSGTLIGGTPGDDLVIIGEVDIDGDSVIDYAGTLLTGEIAGFGSLDTLTPTDRYDFRFFMTGGLLAGYFAGQDIGVQLTSEGSNFAGSFDIDLDGGAKGNVGGIPKLNHPPLCNANGPYEAECAGGITSILLDGTQSSDQDGNTLTYTWTTDCAGATFDDNHSATPTLSIPTGGQCNVDCSVTLVVSDGIASSSPCAAVVRIRDTNAPSITCSPDPVTIACGQPTDTDPPPALDDCDPNPTVTHTDVETAGLCPQQKTITRTWTATDGCGNHASCDQIINVVDTLAPVITCPGDITVSCTQSINPSVTGTATATDNCDPSPQVNFIDTSAPGTCPTAGIITRTWTARDACGNESSCVQHITLIDTSSPTITCPPDVTISCEESKNPSNTGTATANDACDPHPTVTYADTKCGTCPKIISRKWTATDACGNSVCCTQKITVVDNTPPVITCPPNKTLNCGDSTNPCKTGRPTVTDNCDTCVDVSYCDTEQGCCPKTVTRVWKAKDNCGNVSTCTQIINLEPRPPCPKPPEHWKCHRSRWTDDSLQVGWRDHDDKKLMRLLSGKLPDGRDAGSDASALLAKYVIAATFNVRHGATSDDAQSDIDDANTFLYYNPPGSNCRGSARQQAGQLKDRLDRYCSRRPTDCHDDDDDDHGGHDDGHGDGDGHGGGGH